MKKIIAIAAALLLGFGANAQVISTLGYTFEWSPQRGDDSYRVAEMNGIYAGALYNYVLLDFGLGVAGGTYVSYSSGTDRVPGYGKAVFPEVGTREGHRHIAITIPAYVTYTRDLGPGTLFAYAGVAFQGGFRFQAFDKYDNGKKYYYENQFNLSYSNHDRPLDLKVSFGAGYRWKFLQADMGMDFGTIDRNPDPYYSYRIHSFHIGISYVY